MGKTKLTLQLERPEAVYHAGESISGEAIVDVDEEIKVREVRLEVNGSGRVLWTWGKVTYYNSEDYFANRTVISKDAGDSFLIKPGQHRYPFQVTLPAELPSSFEFTHGRVRYRMKLVIDRPWHTDDTLTRAFTVLSSLDLNHVPNALTPIHVTKSKSIGITSSATISATVETERSGYVSGEQIAIHAVFVNQSDKLMKATRLSLCMGIVCHSKFQNHRFIRKLVTIQRPPIHAGGTDVCKGEPVLVPPCAPSGLPGCRIMDIDYFVQVEVDPEGLSFDLELTAPVIIGTIPPKQVLEKYGLGDPVGTPYNSNYPSLPPPSYQAFTAPDDEAAPDDEEGSFTPLYPIWTLHH